MVTPLMDLAELHVDEAVEMADIALATGVVGEGRQRSRATVVASEPSVISHHPPAWHFPLCEEVPIGSVATFGLVRNYLVTRSVGGGTSPDSDWRLQPWETTDEG